MSDAAQKQAERLIIENRNEDGSYDIKGIANDIAELLRSQPAHPVDIAHKGHGIGPVDRKLRERLMESNALAVDLRDVAENESVFYIDLLCDFIAAQQQAAVREAEERGRNEYRDAIKWNIENWYGSDKGEDAQQIIEDTDDRLNYMQQLNQGEK